MANIPVSWIRRGFLEWWVSPTTMGFPTKNDHDLGCEMGVPPFKETPIQRLRSSWFHTRALISCQHHWRRGRWNMWLPEGRWRPRHWWHHHKHRRSTWGAYNTRLVVEPTHLKNVSQSGSFPQVKNKKYLKPPKYCWWFRNPAFTMAFASWEKGSLSHYLQGFIHPKGGDRRISSRYFSSMQCTKLTHEGTLHLFQSPQLYPCFLRLFKGAVQNSIYKCIYFLAAILHMWFNCSPTWISFQPLLGCPSKLATS